LSKKSKPKANIVRRNNKENHKKEKRSPVLKTKESLVHQFLRRWWYAYDWPNKDNYNEELKAHKLRKVEVHDWKIEREVDDKGNAKCIELSGYKGVFRDYKGEIYDFRPKEMCPSYSNFMKKDEKIIYELLIKALKEQLSQMQKNEKYSSQDDKVLEGVKDELDLTLENYKKKFT